VTATAEARYLPSPCVGTCELDRTTGWCRGCGRTGDEIAAWGTLPQPARDAAWPDLRGRLDVLGIGHRLLPWTGNALAEALRRELAGATGSWWTASRRLAQEAGTAIVHRDQALVVETNGQRLYVALAPGLRGFVLAGRRLAFAVHTSRIGKDGIPRTQPLDGLPSDYVAYAGFDADARLRGPLLR
jgi:predicted Fe-S protein YdhL (DUF1289 family)